MIKLSRRAHQVAKWVRTLRRRQGWMFENASPRQLANSARAVSGFVLRRRRASWLPMVVKIDVSPQCNLRCPWCLHGRANVPAGNPDQPFPASQKMSVEQYQEIIAQIAGRSCAASLYYFGDPYVHPDIDQMCHLARTAGLNVHTSTNFSFHFSKERLAAIATSGVTHLTACVDGATQETYERSRAGGNLSLVLSNLEELCAYKREHRLVYPRVEVQMLGFPYNKQDVPVLRERCERLGVDRFTIRPGEVSDPTWPDSRHRILGPRRPDLLPLCYWPYLMMVIRYDGSVIACCNWRHHEQCLDLADRYVLGNVFDEGVAGVWNSAAYQDIRRAVSNPRAWQRGPDPERLFCHGCGVIYHVDRSKSG